METSFLHDALSLNPTTKETVLVTNGIALSISKQCSIKETVNVLRHIACNSSGIHNISDNSITGYVNKLRQRLKYVGSAKRNKVLSQPFIAQDIILNTSSFKELVNPIQIPTTSAYKDPSTTFLQTSVPKRTKPTLLGKRALSISQSREIISENVTLKKQARLYESTQEELIKTNNY